MLIAEDLLLLLLADDTGKPVIGTGWSEVAVGTALLFELGHQGFVLFEEPKVRKRGEGKLVLASVGPTGDELLDESLLRLSKFEGKSCSYGIQALSKGSVKTIGQRLVERGYVEESRGRAFRILPATTWPATDTSYERALRQGLREVLAGDGEPDLRSGALIAILASLNALTKVFETGNRSEAKAMRARAEEIQGGAWANDALRTLLQTLYASLAGLIAVGAAGS